MKKIVNGTIILFKFYSLRDDLNSMAFDASKNEKIFHEEVDGKEKENTCNEFVVLNLYFLTTNYGTDDSKLYHHPRRIQLSCQSSVVGVIVYELLVLFLMIHG